jgi:SAM-dependent methyltransferase
MDKVLKKTQADYNMIAEHFSEKRRFIWPDIKPFLKYIKPGDKVLDAGCGNGRLYKELKDKKVNYLGIDFSQELLKIARREKPKAKFRRGDMSQKKTWKGLKDFDICFCLAVLHHFPTRDLQLKILKSIHQSLKKDGLLVLSVWHLWQKRFWLLHLKQLIGKIKQGFKLKWLLVPYRLVNKKGKVIKEVNRFCYAFTPWELEKIIRKSGFKIIKKKIGRNLCFVAKLPTF